MQDGSVKNKIPYKGDAPLEYKFEGKPDPQSWMDNLKLMHNSKVNALRQMGISDQHLKSRVGYGSGQHVMSYGAYDDMGGYQRPMENSPFDQDPPDYYIKKYKEMGDNYTKFVPEVLKYINTKRENIPQDLKNYGEFSDLWEEAQQYLKNMPQEAKTNLLLKQLEYKLQSK